MKSLPGPWKLEIDKLKSGLIGHVYDANGLEACVIYCNDDYVFPTGSLIASAPDMLDALHRIAQLVHDINAYSSDKDLISKKINLIGNIAMRSIAKTTGEN